MASTARPPTAPSVASTTPLARTRSRSASRSRPGSRAASRGTSPLRASAAAPPSFDAPKATPMSAPSDTVLGEDVDLYPPPSSLKNAHCASLTSYKRSHAASLSDPAAFWGAIADEFTWKKKWDAEFTR